MFHIGNSIGNDLSAVYPADVYAAVRGLWRFNPEGTLETHRLVLAQDSERMLGAFRPKSWARSHDREDRWGFVGELAELSIQIAYVGKRVPERFRGAQNPVRFLAPRD